MSPRVIWLYAGIGILVFLGMGLIGFALNS